MEYIAHEAQCVENHINEKRYADIIKGGASLTKEDHEEYKRLKAAKKAADAAAGLTADPSQQSEAVDGVASGTKRAAQDDTSGDAKAAKVARTNVPLQKEQSMGDGEIIDGV